MLIFSTDLKNKQLNLFFFNIQKRHSLIVVTEKWHMAILAYRDGKVVTRAAGCIADPTGRATDNLFSLTIHRNGLIAIRAFEGSVKMIQWESGTDLRHFNVRFDYPNVSDFKFVDTGEGEHDLWMQI